MPIVREWARRIWYFLNRRRFERELEREMASHRAELQDPRRFGSALRLREQAADVWGWTWIDNLIHDIRYGARQLRQAPAFAAFAILTLALGIGANTAVFSIVNEDFFLDPPVHDPSSLRTLSLTDEFRSNANRRNVSNDAFLSLTSARSVASAACATGVRPARIGIGTTTAGLPLQRVTGDYFRTLGVSMARGRALTATDDRLGAAPVAVISNSMWQRLLGAASDVVGREITVDGAPVTIVGVTPPGFHASHAWRRVDVMVPIAASPPPGLSSTPAGASSAADSPCQPILRLREGVSDAQAQAEIAVLMRPFTINQPRAPGAGPTRYTVRVTRFGRGIDDVDRARLSSEAPQLAAVVFLFATMLLIPCANIAGIMLARTITRRREITARLALGAWRGRIVRQLLTEGLVLSSIAGALGVLLAHIVFLAHAQRRRRHAGRARRPRAALLRRPVPGDRRGICDGARASRDADRSRLDDAGRFDRRVWTLRLYRGQDPDGRTGAARLGPADRHGSGGADSDRDDGAARRRTRAPCDDPRRPRDTQ